MLSRGCGGLRVASEGLGPPLLPNCSRAHGPGQGTTVLPLVGGGGRSPQTQEGQRLRPWCRPHRRPMAPRSMGAPSDKGLRRSPARGSCCRSRGMALALGAHTQSLVGYWELSGCLSLCDVDRCTEHSGPWVPRLENGGYLKQHRPRCRGAPGGWISVKHGAQRLQGRKMAATRCWCQPPRRSGEPAAAGRWRLLHALADDSEELRPSAVLGGPRLQGAPRVLGGRSLWSGQIKHLCRTFPTPLRGLGLVLGPLGCSGGSPPGTVPVFLAEELGWG